MKKQISILCCVLMSVFFLAGCSEKIVGIPGCDKTQIYTNVQCITDTLVGPLGNDGETLMGEYPDDIYKEYQVIDRKGWQHYEENFKSSADLEFKSQDVFERAIESYLKSKGDSGRVFTLKMDSLDIGYGKEGGYEVTVDLVCSDRPMQLALSYNTEMQITNAAFNVQYSIGENLKKAALNTLLGMGTVFCILILISLIISLFGFFPKIEAAKKAKAEAKAKANAPAVKAEIPAPAAVVPEVEELSDDLELVAVIAAAIAAYEGSEDASGYIVRSIKKSKKRHNV